MTTTTTTRPALPAWSTDKKSPEQLGSLYTVRLLFFDGNKRTWHSYRQETIQRVLDGNYSTQINHQAALQQLKQKIIYGKDERGRVFFDCIKSVLVYENLHDRLILKYLAKNKQYEATLGFRTTSFGNIVLHTNTFVDMGTGEIKRDVFTDKEIGAHIIRNGKLREEKEVKRAEIFPTVEQKGAQQ